MRKDLAIIHSYLCSDGYVIKNPPTQKQKYYYVGLRNYNDTLKQDYARRFYRYFGVMPHIHEGRVVKGSKEIYTFLTNKFGSCYSKDWTMPKLSKQNSCYWLRTYFDCEGWVMNQIAKNRSIALDSINHKGTKQIQEALLLLNIPSKIKKRKNRNTYTLQIYGKENLIRYQKHINFLHPKKKQKLADAIASYVDYNWNFENINEIFNEKLTFRRSHYISIYSNTKSNLLILRKYLLELEIDCKVNERYNGLGTRYYELPICQLAYIKKLLNKGVFNTKNRDRIRSLLCQKI